ncbi:hypothetical protein ACLOJK_022777 [Asimina triloba]
MMEWEMCRRKNAIQSVYPPFLHRLWREENIIHPEEISREEQFYCSKNGLLSSCQGIDKGLVMTRRPVDEGASLAEIAGLGEEEREERGEGEFAGGFVAEIRENLDF